MRYTQEGKIGSRYEKGKTRSVLVYDSEELLAFKTELETKTYKPAVDTTPTNTDLDGTQLSREVEGTQLLPLLDGLNHLLVWADQGYQGQLEKSVPIVCGWTLAIVKRTEPGFKVLPRRWVVERT